MTVLSVTPIHSGTICHSRVTFGNIPNDTNSLTGRVGVRTHCDVVGWVLSLFGKATLLHDASGSFYVNTGSLDGWLNRHRFTAATPGMVAEEKINTVVRQHISSSTSSSAPVSSTPTKEQTPSPAMKVTSQKVQRATVVPVSTTQDPPKVTAQEVQKPLVASQDPVVAQAQQAVQQKNAADEAEKTKKEQEDNKLHLRVQEFAQKLLPHAVQHCFVQTEKGLLPSRRYNLPTPITVYGSSGVARKEKLKKDAIKFREEAEKPGQDKDSLLKKAAANDKEVEELDKSFQSYIDKMKNAYPTLFPLDVKNGEMTIFLDKEQREQYEKTAKSDEEVAEDSDQITFSARDKKEFFCEASQLPQEDIYYHGSSTEMVNHVKEHGFSDQFVCKRGESGRATYFALSSYDADKYGDVIKARIKPNKVAFVSGTAMFYVTIEIGSLARKYLQDEVNKPHIDQLQNEMQVPQQALDDKLKGIFARELLREFFVRQNFDAVHVSRSMNANCSYLAVFDTKIIEVLSKG